MLPNLCHHPAPDWLMALSSIDVPLPVTDILGGSVFYPASGLDGRPVKHLAGFSYSFVYVDWDVSQDLLLTRLDTFRGYRLLQARAVADSEFCPRPFTPLSPGPADTNPWLARHRSDFGPYAVWAVYDRRPEFPEEHGPQRFSLLFIGGEGVATFQSLYYANHCAPSVITLILCDAFTHNWTQFFDPQRLLAQSVMQNPYGIPDYLFCVYGHGRTTPWPWYPLLRGTVAASCGKLRLWGSDSARQLAL